MLILVALRAYCAHVTIYGADPRPADDLTPRARILDAAIAQFARHGYARTTFRTIADAAGVSVGLVQHHFGTKAGLRQACDDAVMALVQRKVEASRSGELDRPAFLAALQQQGAPLVRYVARAVLDGSPAAAEIFVQLTEATAAFLSDTWPDRFPMGSARARDAAAVMVAMNLGPVLLREPVARVMAIDADDETIPAPFGPAMLDVFAALGEYVTTGPAHGLRDALEEVPR